MLHIYRITVYRHKTTSKQHLQVQSLYLAQRGLWEWMLLGPSVSYLLPSAQSLSVPSLETHPPASVLPGFCLVCGVSDFHPPLDWVLLKGRNHPYVLCHSIPALPQLSPRPRVHHKSVGWAEQAQLCALVSARGFQKGPRTCLGPDLVSSDF